VPPESVLIFAPPIRTKSFSAVVAVILTSTPAADPSTRLIPTRSDIGSSVRSVGAGLTGRELDLLDLIEMAEDRITDRSAGNRR